MVAPPVAEEQSRDEIARTVALAMVRHLPDATGLQAEYHLVMQHLTGLLWRLGAAHLALRALAAVYRDTAASLRPYVVEDAPIGRTGHTRTPRCEQDPAMDRSTPGPCPHVGSPARLPGAPRISSNSL
jgi:hypothetical protein